MASLKSLWRHFGDQALRQLSSCLTLVSLTLGFGAISSNAADPGLFCLIAAVQCVASPGASGRRRLRLPPRPEPTSASCHATSRSSMKRYCQRQTQVLDLSVWRMIVLVPAPSAESRTIRARQACFCEALRSAITARRRPRTSGRDGERDYFPHDPNSHAPTSSGMPLRIQCRFLSTRSCLIFSCILPMVRRPNRRRSPCREFGARRSSTSSTYPGRSQ